MQYRTMGKTGERVSALGFGSMRMPTLGSPEKIDEPAATRLIHRAIEAGVNYIDTAWFYHAPVMFTEGASEPFLGRILADRRDRVLLATKLPQQLVKSPEEMEGFLTRQLERLATDRIDFYLVHGLDGKAWDRMCGFGVREFLDSAKRRGLIRHTGFSFHGERDDFSRILDGYEGWEFAQIQYNYMDTEFQAGYSGLRRAAAKGLGLVVMEPLKGGRLADKAPKELAAAFAARSEGWSPAEWALRFVWDDPGVSLLLSGMGTEAQLEENLRVADQALPGTLGAERGGVYDAARAALKSRIKADCTACRYCQPCPYGVRIPECLAALNASAMWDTNNQFATGYRQVEGKAGACAECGQCEEACPQGLPIRALLRETKALFGE